MNPDEAQLFTVKSSKPQHNRAQSLQSSAATNDYFSDYASDAASTKSDITKTSYETPPSRMSTPGLHHQHPQIESEMTLPPRTGTIRAVPATIREDANEDRTSRMLTSYDLTGPPTPGVDDTPYIRFAIEQLTLDEDVMGHGRHKSLASDTFSASKLLPHDESDFVPDPAVAPIPEVSTLPSQLPQPLASHPSRPVSRRPIPEEYLLAIDTPEGQRWMELGYLPLPLRLISLCGYIFLCLLMIAGLIFSNVYVLRNHGLYDYDGNFTPRYFVFEYLPQLLGIILIVWLFVIESAMYRTLPYICMSTTHSHDSIIQDFRIINSNFVLPDLTWFRNGEPILGLVFIIFWLMNFTVPLLSCLFQTRWVTDDGPQRWRWTTVISVGWTLFGMYILLVFALVYCAFRFRRQNSALIWDPSSLADLVVIFQRSNLCHDFERTEVSENLRGLVPPKILRLGYWTTSQRPEIFYSVGEENAPIKRLSIQNFPAKPQPNDSQDSSFDMEKQRYSHAASFTHNIHSPFVRYRYIPWFLRESTVLAWMIAAVLLLIAFLVVSFVNQAVKQGFNPLVGTRTVGGNFSSSNFLYSFLPSLLGMFLFVAWQPIDTYFRAVQPFANLSNPAGTSAQRSLLLSYPAEYPGAVSVQALINRDFKVAFISFVGLLSAAIPVLAGGVFTARQLIDTNEIRMVASMPGYITLCALVGIYAFAYLAVWPKRKRYLPHEINTIAGQMSFLYASPLLSDGALKNVNTKADLVGRLIGAPVGLTGDGRDTDGRPKARYAFGIYIGRDGKEHLGIDRLQRPGSGEMLITTGLKRYGIH